MEKDVAILQLEDICFSYEQGKEVLKGINLTFCKGEKVALLGNNGVGKTTMFLISNGIMKPKSGRILLNGKEIKYSKSELIELRRNVGIVFQDADNQIIAPIVEAEVSFGPMNLKLSKDEVLARIDKSLGDMNITHLRKRTTHNLSGGEKKRVSIADILAMNPKMIVLDEPTSSLDSKGVKMLKNTLQELSEKGIAIVLSTHDIDFAYDFADRCVMIADGEVVADQSMQTVFENRDAVEKAEIRNPIVFDYQQKLQSMGIKL